MNKRLQQFLDAENVTQAQFADNIGVARASVSHILAGRNKPGWDFLTSMQKHYPNLNIEWLLSGNGKMYKTLEREQVCSVPVPVKENSEPATENLFSIQAEDDTEMMPTTPRESKISSDTVDVYSSTKATDRKKEVSPIVQVPDNQKKISKILVFFDDNTFVEIQ